MQCIRVSTLNNFNCTPTEWAQLDEFQNQNPEDLFFINCNAKTPLLPTINDHPYRAVITVNPDLVSAPDLVSRVLSLDHSKLAFVRVKWLPQLEPGHRNPQTHRTSWAGRQDICDIISQVRNAGVEVVITAQRFNSRKSLRSYTNPSAYNRECSRYRLTKAAWRGLRTFARQQGARICDAKGLGCLGCGLCATLNNIPGARILSLNLSSSGLCPYNCPDCYAKTMINFRIKINQKPLAFDSIRANRKQRGYTKHIQHARKAQDATPEEWGEISKAFQERISHDDRW